MDKKKSRESGRVLESLIKGLEVLDFIGHSYHSEASLSQISDGLGIYKSRVIRVCGTLEQMGYITHDRSEKLYKLGIRTFSLGSAYAMTNPLVLKVRPSLQYLHKTLGVTSSFYVLRKLKRVCLAMETNNQNVARTREGEERELHYGSTGRIFLAFGGDELSENFFSLPEPYTRLTPFTPTSSGEVWAKIKLIRERGYETSFEERSMGLAGIAVPVFQFGGELAGVLSAAGGVENFTDEKIAIYVPILLQESRKLSQLLGG